MDRRHVVMGVALVASVATSQPAPPPLFYGEQQLDAEPVSLDETRPIRTWVITVDATLPAEAANHDFTSTLEVHAQPSARDSGERSVDPIVVVLSECGSEGVVDGPNRAPSVALRDPFAGCVAQQTCTRTFCVAIGNAGDEAVDVEWDAWASIESRAWVDYDERSIPVPIDITIEEIER